jgi:hypothetical protein
MSQCDAIKPNGERCRGIAKAASDWCPALALKASTRCLYEGEPLHPAFNPKVPHQARVRTAIAVAVPMRIPASTSKG